MIHLIVVMGTLVALNLGFSAIATDKPEEPEAQQAGEVQVEEVDQEKDSLF